MPIRLQRGGAYQSDIGTLRNQIRTNGTNANPQAIQITHPAAAGVATFNLIVNLAYQSNSNMPPANASLYTVGFSNGHGTWHFNVGAIGAPLPGVPIPGGLDGSYGSLDHARALPAINDANLAADVAALAGYNGGAVGAPLKDSLTRMIITVSEAARFGTVADGVNGVFGNGNSFTANFDTLRAWGGHSLGG